MKKDVFQFYLLIALVVCVTVLVAFSIYAQEESGLTRQQRLQMANEHYAKGREFNQQGDYAKANEEFKKAQDLLTGLEGDEAQLSTVTPTSQAEQHVSQSVPVVTTQEKTLQKKKGKQEAKVEKTRQTKAPAVPDEVQKEADNYFRQGLDFARKGQIQEAIDNYNKAIELTPNNTNLHYNLGIEYLKLSKFAEAAEIFKAVIQLNPKEKDAYYNLGVLYDSYLGDKELAKSYYTKYLKLATNADEIKEVKSWIAQIDKEKKELR